jgi:hypothetical protein
VSYTENGLALFGNCAKPKNQNDSHDLDCKHFASQNEAQERYDICSKQISKENGIDDMKQIHSLDIYGLDRDKDGIVCEALAMKEESPPPSPETTPPPTKKTTPTPSKQQTPKPPSTTKPNTYSPTPIPRVDEPYPITTATVRTNPKILEEQ